MTSKDGEDLTRVGAGTVMGEFMRQYWLPAALGSELKADGDPVRLLLLGEKLIAFRDSSGRVGVMDHRCPHRCASLFLGRNEENGLRCVYHGWKYDVDGNCVDMASVPAHQDFKDKVKAKAYKVAERNGVIWVYMGKRAAAPPLPGIEILQLPESETTLFCAQRDCNWLQGLEGDIDTSHFGFLHTGHIKPEQIGEDHPFRGAVFHRAPELKAIETPWGTSYGAYRPADGGGTYWRTANFLFPFWTQQPQGDFATNVHARAWVPLDDTHTMFYNFVWKRPMPNRAIDKNGKPLTGVNLEMQYLPNTTHWLGRWCLTSNEGNDWNIDRAAQRKSESYTGISNIHLQDQAVTESMGPITDHEWEHLAPTDIMISRTRRHILKTAQAFAEDGVTPPCLDDPETYMLARSGFFIADLKTDWQDAYKANLKEAVRPAMKEAAE
ncbi:MAG: Rieske 2Fe-2S domain-containing protein [Stellaceae bacterium]